MPRNPDSSLTLFHRIQRVLEFLSSQWVWKTDAMQAIIIIPSTSDINVLPESSGDTAMEIIELNIPFIETIDNNFSSKNQKYLCIQN